MSFQQIGLLVVLMTCALLPGTNHDAWAKEKPFTVVAFGDSTTAPRMVEGEALPVYADRLQDRLSTEGIKEKIINAGVPSDTTARGRKRFEKEVLAQHPDLVIIQFGLNDSAIDVHAGKDTPRVSEAEYRANLAYFVDTLRIQGSKVILMTPNPMLWTPPLKALYGKAPYDVKDRWGFNLLNKAYANAVRDIALEKDIPVIDVYQRFHDYDPLAGQATEDLLLDGMHPNADGHAMIAELLWQEMQLLANTPLHQPQPRGYTIPVVDISRETERQVVVDREAGQYLGHPTTVLLEDGETMLVVYPKGHGKGPIVLKRSEDTGLSWSERLSVPENWATSKETPTLYRAIDKAGVKRLVMFSGVTPIRMAVSEDDGASWTPLTSIGAEGGVVAMSSMERLKNGDYMALFHTASRFPEMKRPHKILRARYVYKVISQDGGLTWGEQQLVTSHNSGHLCEAGSLRSPDGKQIALLLRENSRRYNSFVVFSNDEGKTWSSPRELPGALTGDRHVAKYAPDGRLFISFRDTTHDSPTKGDWVGWVGRYEDLVAGREGQYRVRLMDNHANANGSISDCAYPGVEVLPEGTIVTTTYGHWTPREKPYIMSVRFTLAELDQKLPKYMEYAG